jgi:hypothetical protein
VKSNVQDDRSMPRSSFCQPTSNRQQCGTSKANTMISLPRSDLGFSKLLLERERRRRLAENTVNVADADCSRRRSNDRPASSAQQSSKEDPFFPIILSKDEIIVENLGIKAYIAMCFGVSLVIVMLYLVMKASWKGKIREFLDVLASSNDAPSSLFCAKTQNKL